MVTTSIYVNTTGHKNDDDLIDCIESDGGLDRVDRIRHVLEELLYDMEDVESFTIKVVDEE